MFYAHKFKMGLLKISVSTRVLKYCWRVSHTRTLLHYNCILKLNPKAYCTLSPPIFLPDLKPKLYGTVTRIRIRPLIYILYNRTFRQKVEVNHINLDHLEHENLVIF